MTEPTDDDIRVAQTIARTFGGTFRVNVVHDEPETHSINVLRAVDRPQPGITSWSTIGLHDAPLVLRGEEFGARVELVGACGSSFEDFGNLLATAAFCIIKDRWFCAPGVIFPGLVRMYRPSSPMQHAMFVPPFLWEPLRTLELGERKVAWLMAVPISEDERRLAESEGPDRLQSIFEEERIDVLDIDRPSVV